MPSPPIDTALVQKDGTPGPIWARWLQRVRDAVRGGDLPYAYYNTATAQTLTNAAGTLINFTTRGADTDNAVTVGAAWKFTVPAGKAGLYSINATVSVGVAGATGEGLIYLRKNGTEVYRGSRGAATASTSAINLALGVVMDLAAGDYIDISVYQSTAADRALEAVATSNWITVAGLRA